MAGQVSELSVQRNKNKEQFQFSQGIWHQTREDRVVPATASMETGAISEHQPRWRKVLIQMTALFSILTLPRPHPCFSPVQGRSRMSLPGRGQTKLL